MLRLTDIKTWTAAQISRRIFLAITSMSLLLFVLFWTLGFDTPYEDSPNFNAPLLTDALLWLMVMLLLGASALTAWSVATFIRKRGKTDTRTNNIPAKAISYTMAITTAALLVLSFSAGSSEPIRANGLQYSSWLWLKSADMFITTSTIMIAVASATIITFSIINKRRK